MTYNDAGFDVEVEERFPVLSLLSRDTFIWSAREVSASMSESSVV